MDKITCGVISDLLPLYCDEVCTPDSRSLVEEHLENCADCRSLLKKMKMETGQGKTLAADEMQGEKIIRGMADVWKKSVIRSFVKGLCAALCGCVVLYAAYWGLIRWPVNVIAPEDVEADAVVDDSRFTVNIMTTDGYKATSVDIQNEKNGRMYIMLKRGIIPMKNGNGAVYGGSYAGALDACLETGETVRIKEIYYGTPGSSVLLWEEN